MARTKKATTKKPVTKKKTAPPAPPPEPKSSTTLGAMRRRFTYHSPKSDQVPRYEEIREKAFELAEYLLSVTPQSREQSLAMTKLEECVMWANKAIAVNE